MDKISAVVIVYNSQDCLFRCLESLTWTDEIVVVDSYSQDDTKRIASNFTDKIYDVKWEGFGKKKEFARQKASFEWILSIDCDEVIPPELKSEISKAIKKDQGCDGFYIPRRSNFLGRWMNHSGWYPDYVLRLFKKTKGRFDQALVHEKVKVSGRLDYLKNPMLHYTDPDINSYLSKLDFYTTLSAKQLFQEKRKVVFWDLVFHPLGVFFKRFFLKKGFLDGTHGFLLAVLSSFQVFIKYTKLWDLQRIKG
ncbi:MAG: hypothetical protein AMJ90_00175 [candidate division Zixibacteria bacterium SM23_73_2]|nr:MAG: hypothetical protein AMJ90_00175 [candidate division Zixibacteria bacterium SM23_73_2]